MMILKAPTPFVGQVLTGTLTGVSRKIIDIEWWDDEHTKVKRISFVITSGPKDGTKGWANWLEWCGWYTGEP